jgi:hypothetical protein
MIMRTGKTTNDKKRKGLMIMIKWTGLMEMIKGQERTNDLMILKKRTEKD